MNTPSSEQETRNDGDRLPVSRRNFLALTAGAAAATAAGCATNPVTGKSQFMLVSESEEIELDQKWSPHQFSSDYGAVQDASLNAYVTQVGTAVAKTSHRPNMPYSFRVLNSSVVNGYTFPGGSVGLDRGLMVMMQSEAELAAVIGHEVGHVSARHMASRTSQQMLTNAVVALGAAYLEYKKKKYAGLAAGLGMIGANMLLMRYSRDDERQADDLGMLYMSRAGHNPKGMIDLMDGFRKLSKTKPNIVEVLFSTHPMSDERYQTAVKSAGSKYQAYSQLPENRDAYMDRMAGLRKIKPAIERMQEGDECMMKEKYGDAEAKYREALKVAPADYAGLLSLAKCLMVQKKFGDALRIVTEAKDVYPEEPQAWHLKGVITLSNRAYADALAEFESYEARLAGNSNTIYFKGVCREQMGQKSLAAQEYMRYLQQDPGGDHAEEVTARLVAWGYIKPAPAGS